MHHHTPAPYVAGEIAHLLEATLREEPPAARPWMRPTNRSRLRLGGYLLAHGYLTPPQLMRALVAQRNPMASKPLPLGDLVVALRYASPRVVATMLMVQLIDQLGARPTRPDRLGERLIFAGLLRPAQLAQALQLQIGLRGSGKPVLLGDILVQHEMVSARQVQRVLLAKHEAAPVWSGGVVSYGSDASQGAQQAHYAARLSQACEPAPFQ